ncbi:TonB-dependent receptor [Chitinophaga sancti]|uniref:Iron complex outermembrane recepter protein n=1 Tax=Chitinophaga sancti TaxID=1004 RepID=A0A1K1QTG9_9BACT|nr:TonB-dependent receptor [Chitinophaga sancti]WQD61919.1 TonB-dependent receptor [Chitinophaga sancti]WQG92512.1 TonB-dependent receptor [Chitinophaga sancti]SFW63176.1 iron complex outermembrane recepter protein [Chitinophaga sancti]
MATKIVSCLALLCLCLTVATAQQKVTGKVTDATTGAPLEGITVRVKLSSAGSLTNKSGEYVIEAKATDVLEISAIGFNAQAISVNGRSVVDVKLVSAVSELNQIVLVGSRGTGRARTETPVPVDVIPIAQAALPTAKTDLTAILNMAAPSLNYNKQSGSDGADMIDLATLRGLGPDQTLVLVNGKRRHQTAFVAVYGTRGRGNSGTDLNAIPEAAIDRVEILRDGASAQYGSDAIAGVINIILKKDVNHLNVTAGYAGYYDHKYNTWFGRKQSQYQYGVPIDGNTGTLGLSYGLPLGRHGGFLNFSGNFLIQGKTYRQALDTDLNHKDGLPVNSVRRGAGDGSRMNGGGMINLEVPLGTGKTSLYAFGGYNYKSSDAFAYSRSFAGHPDRFPTDDGGHLIFHKDIMYAVPDDTIFDPHIQTHVSDVSAAVGVKGEFGEGWTWDVSNTLGRNNFHFYGDKTFNASLGAKSPTHFDDGGFSFLQNTTNVTFTKAIHHLNLAFGAEYRYERYSIYAGEEASYTNYDPTFYKATGSQGFPGYRPSDEVAANRGNIAAYVDAEMDVTDKWLVGAAIRAENYSDFGFTTNYKLATRYKLTSNFNIRASVSTGFRAPSLQQINYSSQYTNVQGGTISEVKIAPNYNAITRAAGIPDLKQEKSLNASLGFTWKPVPVLTVTVDGYYVKVKDRIVLSGQFNAGDTTLDAEVYNTLNALHIDNAQFFANAVNTSNYGVDLVVDYNKRWSNQHFRVLFTGNVQQMSIDKINVPAKLNDSYVHRQSFFSDREQRFVKASAPPVKMGLNLEYGFDKWSFGSHLTYFGKISLFGYGYSGDLSGTGINPIVELDEGGKTVPELFVYKGKLVTDLYVSHKFSRHINLFVGVDNVFNVHPDLGYVQGAKLSAFDGEAGGAWDPVQMGVNGMRLFTRIALDF